MAPTLAESHHHRSTTKHPQKSFKARHATKSSLKEKSKGKIEDFERGSRKTPHQHIMSKLERRNQAKQRRLNHHTAQAEKVNVFSGRDAAPRIVAVVPLGPNVDVLTAIRSFYKSVDSKEMPEATSAYARLNVDRFKQKLLFLAVQSDLFAILDACRTADFVVFVMPVGLETDMENERLIRAVESQGISNVLATVQGLDTIEPPKRRPQVISSLKSHIIHFFPTIEKITSLDSPQETLNLVRSVCTITPKGIRWREERSWMLVEDIQWPSGKEVEGDSSGTGQVVLSGVVRGRGLKADRLVQLGDWGDFQITKITAASSETRKSRGDVDMADQDGQLLDTPTNEQDDLQELAPEEVVMQDGPNTAPSVASMSRKGVLLDDHHYFSDEDEVHIQRPRRLPRGTSAYQSAWYLEDVSDSGSDLEDVDPDNDNDLNMSGGPVEPADGFEGLAGPEGTEVGPSEYAQSEMFIDEEPDHEDLLAYRAARKHADQDSNVEFPDEIELHPHVLARDRLARYRGLKSSRTSPWDVAEDAPHEPAEWQRLLTVSDYKAARSKVLRGLGADGIKAGTRVSVHVSNVPLSLQQSYGTSRPLALFQLLAHEHKRVAANYSITVSSGVDSPLRNKDALILQVGFRRFAINPIFSQGGSTPNDLHKLQRCLQPGENAIASTIAPLTWGPVPVIYFRTDPDTLQLRLVATGTALPPSSSRVIAKRIILTGHPYKIHKRLVTVRYMFFNREDVEWFKSMPLWTKRGRSGFVREALGTHGYFKAVFDGKINPMDAIGVSLWKRCWPKMAERWSVEKAAAAQELGRHKEEDMLDGMTEAPQLV